MRVPHVVIVGGGFGGLAAAKALSSHPVKVTLLDRRNHHLFQPLLYQVATASLAPTDIAEPIRGALAKHRNVQVRMAEVRSIDPDQKCVRFMGTNGEESLAYDYLVLATGVRHSYFGNPQWEDHAPGLKSVGDALNIRRRMLMAFEKAEWEQDPVERQRLLTFVVVGGGPTGVELAGAVAEIAMKTLRSDFRNIDTQDTRVVLVEAADSLLTSFHPKLRLKALKQLQALGVEVRFGAPVSEINTSGVQVGEDFVGAETVLWAAGVEAGPLARSLGGEASVKTDRAGRIEVQPDCSVDTHPELFVIGDAAKFVEDGRQVPGLAPAAIQMGKHVAKVIASDSAGKQRPSFSYLDKGSMATIGRNKAILEAGRVRMSGRFAWLAWVGVHLVTLINFRSRTSVMAKWAWAWLWWDRGGRLVWDVEEGAPEQGDGERRGAA
jgi:NADH dehydrogenase